MKKFILVVTIFLSFSLPVFASDFTSSIEPRASYVFRSVTSSINASAYGGSCSLTDDGSGTITITLQKKLTSNNSWMPVDGASGSKSFSSTMTCAYSKSRILSSGTYRCKTYVKATVNGTTETRTVYSPELTVN